MSGYSIRCRRCGEVLKDSYCAFCDHCADSLLITDYREKSFRSDAGEGIWRFNWLPVRRHVERPGAGPVVFPSRGLGPKLGLKNLWIAFSGYWPEIGANIQTCTFKEFEAAVVLENARENGIEGLVVASAGNAARAFAHLSSVTDFPVVIVVPEMCLSEMWYPDHVENLTTFVVEDGDYSDAIDLARRISVLAEMPFEGGVKNVAKRDGLGIVLLESVSTLGRLPDHYFQAVGSGAGAIATWEMAERFLEDGRYGMKLPRLHLAQNLPFAPMAKAWWRGERALAPEDLTPDLICTISTRVLSTRYPAYGVTGGVFDALTASRGLTYGVTNDDMVSARTLYQLSEGMDIVPAAAVAVAALVQAVEERLVLPYDTILLNITGGGEERMRKEGRIRPVQGVPVSKTLNGDQMEELLCSVRKKS